MSDRPHKRHEGPAHSSPYPVSRLAPPHELVAMAEEIAKAETMLGAVVGAELESIARRIRELQNEARGLLERAQRDNELHHARCNFQKKPGRIYHLYRQPDGSLYFSMLSPGDWAGEPPHGHEGGYRLEADMRWTSLEDVEARDRERSQLRRLLPEPG